MCQLLIPLPYRTHSTTTFPLPAPPQSLRRAAVLEDPTARHLVVEQGADVGCAYISEAPQQVDAVCQLDWSTVLTAVAIFIMYNTLCMSTLQNILFEISACLVCCMLLEYDNNSGTRLSATAATKTCRNPVCSTAKLAEAPTMIFPSASNDAYTA